MKDRLREITEENIPSIMELVIANKELTVEEKSQILKDLVSMQQMGRIAQARMEASV